MAANASAKILVVEDEEPVRTLICAMLSQNGYEILAAGDGEEALSLWRSHQSRIAVVLTDVVMPRMSGPELARRIREVTPQTSVIFMSGYSEEPVIDVAVGPDYAFLAKPFTAMDLHAVVRGAIEKS